MSDLTFLREVEEQGFLWLVAPLFHAALARFRAGVADLPFDPMTVERLVVPTLARTLREALDLVLVLELNVARVTGALTADTPEARFREFCQGLRRPETRDAIASEYPVLVECLETRATNWVDATVELLARFARDREVIEAELAGGLPLRDIVAIELGAGDRHRHGRTVAILELASGMKLVYKPHSLAVDRHFAELLAWIDAAGFETPLRVPAVLDRGDYGWSEFAVHASCRNRDEVERFYHRLGGYLAVFYAVRQHFGQAIGAEQGYWILCYRTRG